MGLVSGMVLLGLSPRVRGNPRRSDFDGERGRSIPACAGEPARPVSKAAPESVYPRVCGGTVMMTMPWGMRTGLSPRVRGNPRRL